MEEEEGRGRGIESKAKWLTILNQELKVKLIKLFEEHFFIGIVAIEAGIYKERIYEWRREQKNFNNAVTHARQE